jgi:hypothetical protein
MDLTADAVQLLGGYGHVSDCPAERMMCDAEITEIYEGTSQVQRFAMARQLLKEGNAGIAPGRAASRPNSASSRRVPCGPATRGPGSVRIT